MESEIETTGINKKGWVGKIKDWSYENWQTILIIFIVLIIGMSAYNHNQQNNSSNENQGTVAVVDNIDNNEIKIGDVDENEINEENNIDQEENSEEITEAEIENKDQEKAAREDDKIEINKNEEKDIKQIEEDSSIISTTDNSGKIYTVQANRGEGITHLARRALNEYLQETGEASELTSEHKIYIEDYLQNRTGVESIEINHQEIFSESLIRKAISSAQQLTPSSLNNLKKYNK